MAENLRHRRRRTALLVVLTGTAILSLQSLLTPQLWDVVDNIANSDAVDAENRDEDNMAPAHEDEGAETADQFFRRKLFEVGDEQMLEEDAELLAIPGVDAVPSNPTEKTVTYTQLINNNQPLPPYTIEDALKTAHLYEHTYALLVYAPHMDTFLGLYSKRHYWVTGCEKLLGSFRHLAYMLRKLFPERFQGKGSDELVIPLSSGDYPGVKAGCLDYFRKQLDDPRTPPGWREEIKRATEKVCDNNVAPVLHFGSVFRQPHLFPNMLAMPMPGPHHLYCFEMWVTHNAVCNQLREGLEERRRVEDSYGELTWEKLIPQVVWRGTDFSYLGKAQPNLQKPNFKQELINWPMEQARSDIHSKEIGGGMNTYTAMKKKRRLERLRVRNPNRAARNDRLLQQFSKAAAVKSLKEQYKQLLPRWKAVVLTAEAEVQAEEMARQVGQSEEEILPWANMKFSRFINGGIKSATKGMEHYKEWEGIDFPATGEYMDLKQHMKYKYHIDLGGGGGTTWTGTVQKLAMPGLLFHHMTPTKDYIHDYMKPWRHYIPVSSDLGDLKRKFEWAESHPERSHQIAEEGTNLMRHLSSREGFEQMFNEVMTEPLRRIIEAYQPVSAIRDQTNWTNWRDALRKIEGDNVMASVIECSGVGSVSACKQPLGKKYLKWEFSHKNKRNRYGGG